MNKRLLVQAVAAFVGGLLDCFYEHWLIPAGMIILFLGINICRQKVKPKRIMLLAVLWGLSWWFGQNTAANEQNYYQSRQEILVDGQEVYLQGAISRKEEKSERYQIYLNNVILQIENKTYRFNQILIYLEAESSPHLYPIGKTLVLKGNIQTFQPATNDGGFDEQQYYKTLQTDCRIDVTDILGCFGQVNILAEKTNQFRQKLKHSIIRSMDADEAGILMAMILGDKSLLPTETREQYQQMGISHILVISGLHISMIGMAIFRLLRKCRMGMVLSAAISIGFLVWYSSMVGMSASTVRAFTMYAMGVVAICLGRTYDRPTALALAVFLLLWQNPYLIENSGFQFSVAAIVGVILAGKRAKAWKVSGMIQLTTMPIAAYCYYELPLWSLPINMLVIPLVSVVVGLGMAGALVGLYSAGVGKVVLWPVQLILGVYEKVGGWCLKLPVTSLVVGKPELIQIFLYCVLLWGSLKLTRWMKTSKDLRSGKSSSHSKSLQELTESIKSNAILVAGLVAALLVLIYRPLGLPQIDILDVGQGDAICIRAEKQMTFFIDGGSSDVSSVGKYRIEPYLKSNAIAAVDYWFVSHTDTDHVSGLIELLERDYPIKHLVLAKQAVRDENWENIVALAEQKKIPICYMEEGDAIQIGSHSLKCIFPTKDFVSTDINASSLVLLYKSGDFSGIFTGDITNAEETLLTKNYQHPVTYYKAAHHGSKYSNSAAWLKQLSPALTTISCSLKNSYGHPSAEAVANITEVGSDIYMTMTDGQISIVMNELGSVEQIRRKYIINPLEVHHPPMIE